MADLEREIRLHSGEPWKCQHRSDPIRLASGVREIVAECAERYEHDGLHRAVVTVLWTDEEGTATVGPRH